MILSLSIYLLMNRFLNLRVRNMKKGKEVTRKIFNFPIIIIVVLVLTIVLLALWTVKLDRATNIAIYIAIVLMLFLIWYFVRIARLIIKKNYIFESLDMFFSTLDAFYLELEEASKHGDKEVYDVLFLKKTGSYDEQRILGNKVVRLLEYFKFNREALMEVWYDDLESLGSFIESYKLLIKDLRKTFKRVPYSLMCFYKY